MFLTIRNQISEKFWREDSIQIDKIEKINVESNDSFFMCNVYMVSGAGIQLSKENYEKLMLAIESTKAITLESIKAISEPIINKKHKD